MKTFHANLKDMTMHFTYTETFLFIVVYPPQNVKDMIQRKYLDEEQIYYVEHVRANILIRSAFCAYISTFFLSSFFFVSSFALSSLIITFQYNRLNRNAVTIEIFFWYLCLLQHDEFSSLNFPLDKFNLLYSTHNQFFHTYSNSIKMFYV